MSALYGCFSDFGVLKIKEKQGGFQNILLYLQLKK